MGLMANLKANKAMGMQAKGDVKGALKLYEEAIAAGANNPRVMLAYALLLIRQGQYVKAKELLIKTQKASGLTPDQKSQLFMDYAVCCHKLGDTDKGVNLLERQHRRTPTGLTYQTLGYLYVEQYDMANREAFLAAQPAPVDEDDPYPTTDASLTREEAWQQGVEKTLAFNKEAVDYDDEDAVCLDNLAQTYYRVLGDKAAAKEWFDKALKVKPGQIDTLWFLSRYDLEKGDTAAAIEKLEDALDGRFSPLNYAGKDVIEAELKHLKG